MNLKWKAKITKIAIKKTNLSNKIILQCRAYHQKDQDQENLSQFLKINQLEPRKERM